ncbi:leucine-rich repeat domain-containing protein [Hahella sp. HN01]|uniref:leucine-rich repeat domain-containing protein n=1 Tax=Hahella sp. HN01 TaxID=2847262 RepID=UPI001C1EC0B2|nr:leucine-rich repeat domain-containing protein [Hahella sp. HN01]MBU6951406.1 leucine-rich repeat domain-containing protein [Hahella sp. HN01]
MLQRTLALMIFTLFTGCGQSEPQKAEPEANNAPQYSEAEVQRLIDVCKNRGGEFPMDELNACIKLNKYSRFHTLDLSRIKIRKLPENIFEGMIHIRQLFLNENSISALPESIKDLVDLKVITLDWNKFESVPEELFEIDGLRDIYISHNSVTKVDQGLKNSTKLRRIILSFNKLEEFPAVFSEMPNLKILDLASNSISRVPKEIGGMSSLIGLSLADNKVEEVPEEIGALSNLTMLDLSANKLKTLPVTIARLPNLTQHIKEHSGFVNNLTALGFEEDGEEIYGVTLLKGYQTTLPVSRYSGINILFNDIDELDKEFCNVFFINADDKTLINCDGE